MGSRRVSRRVAASAIALLAPVALAVACTSPTLPLPPPAAPSITAGSEPDTVRLASIRGTLPNALVLVVNQGEDVPREKRVFGTIADGEGSWELEVYAKPGNPLDVSQETGSVRSPPVSVVVK
jgi:hypothetical protein